MPFIGSSTRIGPDLDTEWGTYTSPFFTAPADAKGRGIHFLPNDIRGRHQFRVQPRSLSMIPDDPAWAQPGLQSMLERTRSSLVPENAEAFGQDTYLVCEEAATPEQRADCYRTITADKVQQRGNWMWAIGIAAVVAYLVWRR